MYQLRAAAGAANPPRRTSTKPRDRVKERFKSRTLKLDHHVLTFSGRTDFKKLALLEAEHSRQNVRGKRLDLGIKVTHDGVVIAARVLNVVFCLAQLRLQG